MSEPNNEPSNGTDDFSGSAVELDEFHRAADRFVAQIMHWTPQRWKATSGVSTFDPSGAAPENAERSGENAATREEVGSSGASSAAEPSSDGADLASEPMVVLSRADVMYRLVQRIADLAADAEGQPRRLVPRLTNDLALVDQFRVVTADLLTARPGPETIRAAMEALTATRRTLFPSAVPPAS